MGVPGIEKLVWTDDDMLDALHMHDRLGLSAAQIDQRLGRSRSAVLGLFKRIADDEAAAGESQMKGDR